MSGLVGNPEDRFSHNEAEIILYVHFVQCFTGCASLVYGVEHYSLSYSYFDEIAQAYCAASYKGWTFAVRRDSENATAPICKEICAIASQGILESIGNTEDQVACYDAIFIEKEHPRHKANPGPSQPDANVVNMGSYGYHGKNGCDKVRPNYCCCRAYSINE